MIPGVSPLNLINQASIAVGLHAQSLVGADAPSKSQQVCCVLCVVCCVLRVVCCVLCVCCVVCVVVCCVLCWRRKQEGGRKEEGRRRRQPKNKNPTQQCGGKKRPLINQAIQL